MTVLERFLNYVVVETTSDPYAESFPSTKSQLDFGHTLMEEMKKLGLTDVTQDEYGYVFGTIPSTVPDYKGKILGLIAHMDTAPAASGKNIKPRVIKNYDGAEIVLNAEKKIVMKPEDFPSLKQYVGQDLVVTDGLTLLGGDDKAGVAEIMTAAEYLIGHPEIPHGPIRVGFTPDEEVGKGADFFDVKKFGADFAYTVDGGECGELEYENFNAAAAKITFKGLNVHPGYAKNKMLNASLLAIEFASWLPASQRPEHTQGYEGFYHLTNMSGTVEEASLSYIIRDHVRTLFEEKKAQLKMWVKRMNEIHPGSTTLELRDQYYNMREVVEPKKYIVDLAFEAMESVGVKPLVKPIRGGTDGARLSFMGLPCPNIFAGGLNFHGRYEFLPVNSLEKSMQTIIKITELLAQKS